MNVSKYRQTEKWIYQFPVNLMRLHESVLALRELRQQTDCHAQRYDSPVATPSTPADPVATYYARIETLAGYVQELGQKTTPIQIVRGRLKNSSIEKEREMFFMMELFYFERRKLNDIAVLLQKSAKTLSRRKHELVEQVMTERRDTS